MQPKTPKGITIHAGKTNFLVTGLTRHQIVWFHWQSKCYIRALMDGRIMEVIKPDEPMTDACNWVLEADINDNERAYAEEQTLKVEIIKHHIFPIIVWKQKELFKEYEIEESIREASRTFSAQVEKSGFDFSFLETFR